MKLPINLNRILIPLVFMVVVPLHTQQVYFEPEYGFYRPSDWARVDSIGLDTLLIQQDYDFSAAPRWGGDLGLRFDNGYEVYAGYRQWSSTAPRTTIKTYSTGIRNTAFLKERRLGYRAGFEYYRTVVASELDTAATNGLLWTFKGKGSGTALETGLVYRLTERINLFAGFDYLMYRMIFDRLTRGNVTYIRKELGLNKTKATVDMRGFNLKISLSLILSGPLEFAD